MLPEYRAHNTRNTNKVKERYEKMIAEKDFQRSVDAVHQDPKRSLAHEWPTLLTVLFLAQSITAKVIGPDRKMVVSLKWSVHACQITTNGSR